MDSTYSELQTNAFLKLTDIDNYQELIDEFKSLTLVLSPYTIIHQGKKYTPLDLDVASLIDVNDDPTAGGLGYNLAGSFAKHRVKETSLAKHAPKIMDTLYRLFGRDWIRRVKISKLPPSSNMLLHRHPYLDLPNGNNEVVVHIPLQTNNNVLAVVDKLGDGKNSKKTHFSLGSAWYLNTFYHHKFENNGTEDRYHLWINLVWNDTECGINPNMINMVKENLDKGIKV